MLDWIRRELLVRVIVGVGVWVLADGAIAMGAPASGACDLSDALPSAGAPGEAVVLAVLSPRMPYALPEWSRMAGLARRAGFQVIVFRDASVPPNEWHAATGVIGSDEWRDALPLNPEIAEGCRLLNHSPTVLVMRCGQIHPWPIWGVMPDAAWQHVLKARRADLERLPCP
ncbi:hypothetical protein [Ottowia testudinis]|uniref:Uncharacterized protein n=1 Tax=Ottowia testudinis TaxID=2816950 RepID=A0A975H215_9BURK|nr:hypothetical protein [Ottowia testudinis]QTD44403.1 hypothetical protein J1M35_15040 [Ottowia testudinis]